MNVLPHSPHGYISHLHLKKSYKKSWIELQAYKQVAGRCDLQDMQALHTRLGSQKTILS